MSAKGKVKRLNKEIDNLQKELQTCQLSNSRLRNKNDRLKTELEEQKADMIKRFNSENERFFRLYGVHKEDMSNYDFVLDTTNHTIEENAKIIEEEYKKWLEI